MMLTRVLLVLLNTTTCVRAHVAKAAQHAAQDRLVSNIEPAVGTERPNTEPTVAIAATEPLLQRPASQCGHGMIARADLIISATSRCCGTLDAWARQLEKDPYT
jgi:hypothetical protein